MLLSKCCEAPFPEPGYPDTDLCGKCYEHTDAYDDEPLPVSEQINELLLFDMTRRKIEAEEVDCTIDNKIKKANINEVLRRFDVTRMPYIAKLAEDGNLKELTEEVANLEVAQEFIDAYEKIKSKKDEPAYKELNKMQTKYIKEATNKDE